jgi:hypothetical protein
MSDVTRILNAIEQGDAPAADPLNFKRSLPVGSDTQAAAQKPWSAY